MNIIYNRKHAGNTPHHKGTGARDSQREAINILAMHYRTHILLFICMENFTTLGKRRDDALADGAVHAHETSIKSIMLSRRHPDSYQTAWSSHTNIEPQARSEVQQTTEDSDNKPQHLLITMVWEMYDVWRSSLQIQH